MVHRSEWGRAKMRTAGGDALSLKVNRSSLRPPIYDGAVLSPAEAAKKACHVVHVSGSDLRHGAPLRDGRRRAVLHISTSRSAFDERCCVSLCKTWSPSGHTGPRLLAVGVEWVGSAAAAGRCCMKTLCGVGLLGPHFSGPSGRNTSLNSWSDQRYAGLCPLWTIRASHASWLIRPAPRTRCGITSCRAFSSRWPALRR